MEDFNFDLFKLLQSVVGKFEDIFLSQGLYPLISLATHKTNSSSSKEQFLKNNFIFLQQLHQLNYSNIDTFININKQNQK